MRDFHSQHPRKRQQGVIVHDRVYVQMAARHPRSCRNNCYHVRNSTYMLAIMYGYRDLTNVSTLVVLLLGRNAAVAALATITAEQAAPGEGARRSNGESDEEKLLHDSLLTFSLFSCNP